MTQPPKLSFPAIDPLQDFYRDRDGNRYGVARLADLAKGLPVFEAPLAAIDLEGCYAWRDCTLHGAADHLRRAMKADLNVPILLDWNGSIADGRHRIVKALMRGKRTIKAKRLTFRPEPDHIEPQDK